MMLVVLEDGSTFATDGWVIVLTDEGQKVIETHNDVTGLLEKHAKKVLPISELLDAWEKVNGKVGG